MEFPEGADFLAMTHASEDQCEGATRDLIASWGSRAPATLESLGTVLSLAYRSAACFWGCSGGEHTIEYLVGRVVCSARSALRLLYFGYYDESLTLTRSIGEV